MNEASHHNPTVGLGHRLDEIHTHRETRRSILPWLILGLLAFALLAWAFTRNREAREDRAIEQSSMLETESKSSTDTNYNDNPADTPR